MSEPELTPVQTDAVRRSLRAACHDAPVPDEVAARLDDRLAELVAERTTPVETTVVTLRRRRRRRWPAVLAAAAAVTAVGLAGTQLVDRGGQGDALSTAESTDDRARKDAADRVSPTDGYDSDLGVRGESLAPLTVLTAGDLDQLAGEGYRRVRLLATDTAALADQRAAQKNLSTNTSSPEIFDAPATAAYRSVCGADLPADLAPGAVLYRARHEGDPVVLLVAPGPEVSAYPCGGGDPTVVPLD